MKAIQNTSNKKSGHIMSHENTLSSVYIVDTNNAVPYKEKVKAEKETIGL